MSSIKPNSRSDQMDGSQEVSSCFIISGGYGSVLFKFSEEVFDEVPGLVEVFIVRTRVDPILFWGNDRLTSFLFKFFSHTFVCVISLVS